MTEQVLNLSQLLYTFQLFDTNKDGAICANELRSACQKLQMPIDESKLREIFQTREMIQFDEFCQIVKDCGQYAHDAYLHETFRAFDRNSDGFITAKEIKQTMKDLGEKLTDKQAKDMLKVADANRDGKLSLEEFRSLFDQITHKTTTPPLSPMPSAPGSARSSRTSNPFKVQTE